MHRLLILSVNRSDKNNKILIVKKDTYELRYAFSDGLCCLPNCLSIHELHHFKLSGGTTYIESLLFKCLSKYFPKTSIETKSSTQKDTRTVEHKFSITEGNHLHQKNDNSKFSSEETTKRSIVLKK